VLIGVLIVHFVANVRDLHDDALRELAVNQLEPSRCATGGVLARDVMFVDFHLWHRSRQEVVRVQPQRNAAHKYHQAPRRDWIGQVARVQSE
jgi:hypothetical protein